MPLRRRTWAKLALAPPAGGRAAGLRAAAEQAAPATAGSTRQYQRHSHDHRAAKPLPKPSLSVLMTVPDDGLSPPVKPIPRWIIRAVRRGRRRSETLPAKVSVEMAGPTAVAVGEPLRLELVARNTGGSGVGKSRSRTPCRWGSGYCRQTRRRCW